MPPCPLNPTPDSLYSAVPLSLSGSVIGTQLLAYVYLDMPVKPNKNSSIVVPSYIHIILVQAYFLLSFRTLLPDN